MPNTFIHGRLGTITIGGTLFASEQYDYTEEIQLEDITYTVSGGVTFQVLLPGYAKVSGTITFVYDTSNQPVLSPQNMIPGTLMALVLYPDGTKPYTFSAYAGTFRFPSGPKAGPVRCTTNFQSTGNVTRPLS